MEGAIMRIRTLAPILVALPLVVMPAHAADDGRCEQALSKASTKFVAATFKSMQRCLMLKRGGKLGAGACNLSADSTGNRRTDAALGHAEGRLAQGLSACSDGTVAGMDFQSVCPNATSTAFGRDALVGCIADTHRKAVAAAVSVEFPQLSPNCGNGVIDAGEDCDPVANPTGCNTGERCVPAGAEDECTCVEQGSGTCGDGTIESGEACDPSAVPTGCPAGMTCGSDCTCSDQSGNQCEGTCSPACTAGQSCRCACASGTCGNGVRDPGEQCDPMANPSGCATGMICGEPGTAQQCTCFTQSGTCGNGILDPGEACDPALPNTCDPGEVCLSSGAMACTCGAPPSNCGNGLIEWGEQCDPAANPTGCAAGQTCAGRGSPRACTCVSGSPGGAFCGNGMIDPGEQCDPAASPTGCAANQTCSGQCTCSGASATCGNGTIDPGEQCDPAANPPGCPVGSTCSATCTCGGATTTTLPSGGGATLSFTTTVGTASCGGAGLNPAPPAPHSGQLFSDPAATSAITGGELGLGCLYIGGGNATSVPPDQIPDSSTEVLSVSGTSVSGNAGSGPSDCTLGAKSSQHCIGAMNNGASCTSDTQCQASLPGSCAPDAQCFFGPPLPIPNGGLSTCVLNVIKSDASGSTDPTTGSSNLSLPLFSRTYLTGNATAPCPRCSGGTCQGGAHKGMSCTPTGVLGTTLDCPPLPAQFLAPLDVTLSPLTTGTATMTSASGSFCPSQANAGAFGKTNARAIVETGKPAGSLTDGAPHNSVLASVFCIPQTGNIAIDIAADLPGPGAIGLNGTAHLTQ
jgi:hypothetical protein